MIVVSLIGENRLGMHEKCMIKGKQFDVKLRGEMKKTIIQNYAISCNECTMMRMLLKYKKEQRNHKNTITE